MTKPTKESGAVELRKLVAILNANTENWTEGYSLEEIVKVLRAVRAGSYDYGPDHMSGQQLRRAIELGESPKFCDYCGVPRDRDQYTCEECGKESFG